MEIDSAELIERTNLEEEESKLSRTFFMFVYSVVFHFCIWQIPASGSGRLTFKGC